MCLAPLDRTLSLAVPPFGLTTLAWLGLVSAPLLIAVGSVAYVQGMRFQDLGLALPARRAFPLQLGIALTGIPLGFAEYLILRPIDWLPGGFVLTAFLGGVLVLLFATGVAEEVLFRGILLRRATDQLGRLPGLLFATVAFSLMHLFYNSPLDLALVFSVGLLYGTLVLRTKSLWGVIMSHTFDNVILYLVAPFLLLPHLPL
jgi:membrane protease YdiL (CAAX protease family)